MSNYIFIKLISNNYNNLKDSLQLRIFGNDAFDAVQPVLLVHASASIVQNFS